MTGHDRCCRGGGECGAGWQHKCRQLLPWILDDSSLGYRVLAGCFLSRIANDQESMDNEWFALGVVSAVM